jgi:hypothetical protein
MPCTYIKLLGEYYFESVMKKMNVLYSFTLGEIRDILT